MGKINEIAIKGNKYNKWTVLSSKRIIKNGRERIYCNCICECGKIKDVAYDNLISLKTISCGCHHKKLMQEKLTIHGFSNKNATSEYHSWCNMRDRCNNKNNHKYKNYGGRGITVCDRWDNFLLFLEDVGKRPSKKYTLERKDVNGNYEPSNCVWATSDVQARNRTDSHFYEYNGENYILADWEKKLNIKRATLFQRINYCGWTIEKAFTTPTKLYELL